jgi:hypothetical protein
MPEMLDWNPEAPLIEVVDAARLAGAVVVVVGVDRRVVATGMVGTVGSVVPGVVANGDTSGVGIVAQEPTPRLAISEEPSGMPTLGLPPGVVGAVDVGVDGDAASPFESALHVPVTPTVPMA